MKIFKVFAIIIATAISFTSCTENNMAKHFGGEATVNLEKGMKLIEATWKENDLWYLVEPMDDDYVPKTKYFKEESSYGIIEGCVKFVESR